MTSSYWMKINAGLGSSNLWNVGVGQWWNKMFILCACERHCESGLPTFTGAQMLFQLFKLCHFMLFSVKLKIVPFYSIFKATISKFSKLCHIMLFWYVFFFLRLRRLVLGKNKISKYLWTCETPPYSEKGWGEWGVYEWVYSKYLTVERNLTPWEIL